MTLRRRRDVWDLVVIGGGIAGLTAAWHGMRRGLATALFEPAPGYGGPTQAVAVCYISNLGNTSVSFTSARIYKEFGVAVPLVTSNCGTLTSQASCRYVANIANSVAHWCRADVSSKGNLRGRLEIRNGSAQVLSTESMR